MADVKNQKQQKEETQEESKAASSASKFTNLIKQIEELSVLELSELVKELEDRFGVSAAAPMAVAGTVSAAGAAETQAEEKSSFDLHLADAGSQKIAVIKAIREIRSDLGLKEAKDLVDGAPKEVKKAMPKEEAEAAKKKLEEAGAKVELK